MKPTTPIIDDAETEADGHEREVERHSTRPHRHEFVDLRDVVERERDEQVIKALDAIMGMTAPSPLEACAPALQARYDMVREVQAIVKPALIAAREALVERVCVHCSMSEAHAELAARDAARRAAR